jgi:N-methylhydantoinase B
MMDPISLEVFHEALVSTVGEMRATVMRTAFSSIIYEGQDFSCALMDACGRLVVQSKEDNPSHVGPLNMQVPAALEKFKGDLHPGDVVIANDPFTSGTHLNDVAVMVPLFFDGRLLLFACTRAHWGDVGGMTPGSISGRTTEIFQEGLRIPIMKAYDRGRPNDALLDLMFANVRQPSDRKGDFMAQLATARTAEERLGGVVRRFGVDEVEKGIATILDRSEFRIRKEIGMLRQGSYLFEDYLDSDGNSSDQVRIRVKVTVGQGELEVDFSGTSAQREGPINASLAVTSTAVFVSLKALLDPQAHINEGAFRPIKVIAPAGSVVNAVYPAPMGGFMELFRRVSGTLFGALSRACPDRIAGDTKGCANHIYIACFGEKGVRSIHYEYPAGGTGGFAGADGSNAVREWDAGDFSSIQSVELVEHEHPCTVERTELRTDSGGPGCHRGGLGMRRVIRLDAERALLSVLSDRNILTPFGVMQGFPGAPNRFLVLRDGRSLTPSPYPGKISGFPIQKGDQVVMLTAGGGGYGDPLERDPRAVLADLKAQYITKDCARRSYGVVARTDEIDDLATAALRQELRNARRELSVRRWKSKGDISCPTHRFALTGVTMSLLELHEGAFVELGVESGAPMRGQIRSGSDLPEGCIGLEDIALEMLGLDVGDTVWLRPIEAFKAA